jgi:hypothetical protein
MPHRRNDDLSYSEDNKATRRALQLTRSRYLNVSMSTTVRQENSGDCWDGIRMALGGVHSSQSAWSRLGRDINIAAHGMYESLRV